jgi:hypothetical protein
MVTHEEKHTTRGRARTLFEMMQGEVIQDGWASEEVKDALDLCLACKGLQGRLPGARRHGDASRVRRADRPCDRGSDQR